MKSSSLLHISKLVVLTLAVLSAFAGLFQNCSKVAISDETEDERNAVARVARIGAAEVTVEVGNSQYNKSTAAFAVGLDSVPPLKQVWIVDNSGTMVANNINLANSFGAMFSQSNKDSLYKFDTTAYLLSTAQTIPSYKSADKALVDELYSLQSAFNANPAITENDFNANYRTADLNSGKLPGDNVGTKIVRTGTSSTDFSVIAAPVLGVSMDSGFELKSAIHKPANVDTVEFEENFKDRLGVLRYQRVPKIVTNVNGLLVENAQSAKILDTESGLCGLARVLDNPNGIFNPSDLLAVTIVSDENENDVQGLKCLKRTAYLRGTDNYVSGKCVEYRTPFSFQMRARDAKTCTINGEASYTAEFSYTVPYANISYYSQKSAASITSTTPQTKISWQTPKTKKEYKQLQTSASYYTWKTVPAVYTYYMRQVTVKYYTKVCKQTNADGTSVITCVASESPSTKVIDGTAYTTCNAAAVAANSNAVVATSDLIASDKLPDCSATTAERTISSCNTSDTVNCRRVTVSEAYNTKDQGPLSSSFVGDRVADCDVAVATKGSNVILSTNTAFPSYKPTCNTAAWVTLTGGSTCTASSTCDVKDVADTPANGSAIVLGAIANGSPACLTNSNIPAGAISGSVACGADAALVTNAACTTAQTAAGCSSTSTPESLGYTSSTRVDGMQSLANCETWVASKTNNRTDASHPIVCELKTETKYATSTRTFVQAGTSSLNVGDVCGDSSSIFYNALSSADKALVPSATASSVCKIKSVLAGIAVPRPLAAGSTCLSQLSSDCSALNYRNCRTADSGGGFTSAYSAWSPLMAIKNKNVTCSSICSSLPAGSCESWSDQNITVSQYLTSKYGPDVQVQCRVETTTEVNPAISTITDRLDSERASFCSAGDDGTPRYFVATTTPAPKESYVDEFVAGNSEDGLSPKMDLIQFIKSKVEQQNLNINISVFIRRSQDPDGVGSGINYKGIDYERMINVLTTPSAENGSPIATGQVFSVLESSYEAALTNLSSVLKGKLIRSFTIAGLQDWQVVTAVKITSPDGVRDLTLGQWNQVGKVINIAKEVSIKEGDSIEIQYQNNDGYVYAQLKKVFIIDQMRPDQIIKSIEQQKKSGLVIQLTPEQYVKDGNKVTFIDSKIVIESGDRFRIQYKNNVDED